MAQSQIVKEICRLPPGVTSLHERYRKCVGIKTRVDADAFLRELTRDHMQRVDGGISWDEALATERANIGYWAGCYLRWAETLQVFRMFHTASPVFGDYHPEVHEAFWAGGRVFKELAGTRVLLPEELDEMHHWTNGLHRWRA